MGCVLIYFCNKQFEINKDVDCCLMTCHYPDLSYFLSLVTTSCNWACVFLGSSKLLILPSLVYFQSIEFFNHVMF